jgi:hypothetical protein
MEFLNPQNVKKTTVFSAPEAWSVSTQAQYWCGQRQNDGSIVSRDESGP